MRVNKRVAVVTGAAQGIGRAIARQLARQAVHVVVADIDDKRAAEVAAELTGLGYSAQSWRLDVSDAQLVSSAIEDLIADAGGVDILINNAGVVGPEYPVHDLPDEQWHRIMAVNLHGVFYCSRAVLPGMLNRKWGRIVNITSIAGKEGVPNIADYAAAKAGAIEFAKCLAKEVARSGITVNSVTPGLTDGTDMARGFTEEQRAIKVAKVPMGRMATPDEVAAVAVFLASEDASFVTGAVYDVTGGRSDY